MATLHLIHGFCGAGKTTFAKRLEKDVNAIRFSIDEWMVRLYGDSPSPKVYQGCEAAIKSQIQDLSSTILAHGIDVIFDFGFWRRTDRDTYRGWAAAHGIDVLLYNIFCDKDIMEQRVLERTLSEAGDQMKIDKRAFDLFWAQFEPLEADESHILIKNQA